MSKKVLISITDECVEMLFFKAEEIECLTALLFYYNKATTDFVDGNRKVGD
ncbi:MAG: hypothetical protein SFU99_11815 [Saprospiraceae bacterium]|nr:hypothetical protein [Saprospiraceae bacterium]